jgi:hypothetical protein
MLNRVKSLERTEKENTRRILKSHEETYCRTIHENLVDMDRKTTDKVLSLNDKYELYHQIKPSEVSAKNVLNGWKRIR